MKDIESCAKCSVPMMLSSGHKWGDNGVISLAMSPRNRMVFYESGNIDHLFGGIERMLGMPIEHIVIESRRRETRKYMERIYGASLKGAPDLVRDGLLDGSLPMDSAATRRTAEIARELNVNINNIGRIYGYGEISLGEGWEVGDDFPWRTQVIRQPYSLPLYAADMLGSVEAVEGRDMWVEYEESGVDTYRVAAFPSSHPVELSERLQRHNYDFKEGDIDYERCPACGLPGEVTRCIWDLDAGTITDPEGGRRMAIFGPGSLDAILGDLEAELGEALPQAVVSAQREYVREHVGEENWKKDALSFRRMIAARGLGNLASFDGDRNALNVTIENACLHLLISGTTQAMVEMVYGADDSTCEWNLTGEGDLKINIRI